MIDHHNWDLWIKLIQIALEILGGAISNFVVYLDDISISYHK
jgi:hypothetical protein